VPILRKFIQKKCSKNYFGKQKKEEKPRNKNTGKNVKGSVLNATSVKVKNLNRRSIIATDQDLRQWFNAIDLNHEDMISIKIFKYFLIETGSYSNESEAKMPKLMKYFLQDSKYIVFNEFSMLCEALKVELNGMNIDKLNKIMEKYDEKADLDIEMQQPRR
jgi:hypothetical protein